MTHLITLCRMPILPIQLMNIETYYTNFADFSVNCHFVSYFFSLFLRWHQELDPCIFQRIKNWLVV